MNYPNPDKVVYATTQPTPFPCQLTTDDGGTRHPMHKHGAFLNKAGDGNTDMSSGHIHRVRNFKVIPDLTDGHTHELTTLPCGTGMPRATARNGPVAMLLGEAETPEIRAQLERLRIQTLESNYAHQKRMVGWAVGLGVLAVVGVVVTAIVFSSGD